MRIPYFKRLNKDDKEIYNAMMQLVKKQHLKLDKDLTTKDLEIIWRNYYLVICGLRAGYYMLDSRQVSVDCKRE